MTRRRSTAWLAGFAAALGCTVGDGGGATLSGSASASTTVATTVAQTDDGPDGSSDQGDGPTSDTGASAGPTTAADSTGDTEVDGSGSSDAGASSSGAQDGSSTGGGNGIEDGVLDVTIIAHDDCTITTMPAVISVPEGTEFTVNWISAATSEAPVDVAKIDRFNAVPIILGMEPGTSYHDEVRVWCGLLFTGTFDFEITSCFDPQLIPVDCGG